MIGIIGRALTAHEGLAIYEHFIRIRHGSRAPAVAHIDGFQVRAIKEHPRHIGHLGRVETAQVKTC